jgi:micrococcal nuclease
MDTRAGSRARWSVHAGVAIVLTMSVVVMSLGAAPAEAGSRLGPSYRVKGVSDGDTIKVTVKGRTERVRLIGIDTPELGRDGSADQCHAREAQRQMRKLVQGKRVHLQRDSTQANRDAYGRLLRYVYTAKGRRDVGKTLIKKGHGREYTYKGRSYKHRSAHLRAQRSAQNAGRGLWGECAAPAPAPAPEACVIKGNIADDGEKIYHVPGQEHYDETVITPAKGERWFCTEADALAAGWRKALA